MSSKCFVPSCKNNVGIAFPDDPEIKEKWLDILGIPHLKPKSSSFVCLDHFQDDDEDVDELPNTDSGKISSNLKQVTNKKNPEQIVVEGKIVNIESVRTIRTEKPESDGEADTDQFQGDTSSKNTEICRLCMEQKEDIKNIFVEEIEDSIPIVFAILACIHPIEISYEDNLPKTICVDCLNILQVCFKFRSVCLKNDKIQKQLLRKQVSPNTKKQKRYTEEQQTEQVIKKIKSTKSTDIEDKYDELEAINEFLVKKDGKEMNKSENTKNEQDDKKSQEDSQNESMNRMEEELRKVLEGTLSEEHASADNIIIHIENDDDSADGTEEALSNVDLPSVVGDSQKTVKSKRTVVHGDYSFAKTGNILSKEGNVKSGKVFKSNVGVFEGTPLTYFYDIQFCEVDDYLFEYRIAKQTERYLRCLLPSCSAIAMQSRLEKFVYSNEVTVLIPHNHKRPSESEKKKQMFFYVMKRKMHSDKTLKFKNVYDDVCQKDPEIKQLIPLRNVINEICRHQFNHKLVPITSFEVLCNIIEDDAYQKFQFTLEGAQFYQEKFTAEDNAKAIVFANLDTIEEMSDSDLMYIDASFKIESGEAFSYQLVTVLVWIEESYYPIMFALVNYKTQEIYKKIFEFLHDTVAPRLRPDEIVTEYESNLYYALGETYVDSSIGGSAFYYTQNIYKKICHLDLAKDLETNTFFRNVYHMLLMLPLLPVNTIMDGFQNIQAQATQMGITHLTKDLFEHVESEWLNKVTPDLFCVHRLENRINENVIAPFKKLRDYIMLSKGRKNVPDIMVVIEKLIELEQFLHVTYTSGNKKSFARDLSSAQKKNVLRAWQFIETHPKININNFFSRVLGYIKCMENQLWIWGFYRYKGEVTDELINASNFSIISSDEVEVEGDEEIVEEGADIREEAQEETENKEEPEKTDDPQIVMDAVIDENGGFVLKPRKKQNSKTYNVNYK